MKGALDRSAPIDVEVFRSAVGEATDQLLRWARCDLDGPGEVFRDRECTAAEDGYAFGAVRPRSGRQYLLESVTPHGQDIRGAHERLVAVVFVACIAASALNLRFSRSYSCLSASWVHAAIRARYFSRSGSCRSRKSGIRMTTHCSASSDQVAAARSTSAVHGSLSPTEYLPISAGSMLNGGNTYFAFPYHRGRPFGPPPYVPSVVRHIALLN